jgi:imidazolonepropionase-like amidohydrolase
MTAVMKASRYGSALLLLLLVTPHTAAAQATVLQHATLIDGTGAAPRPDMTLLLDEGRIRELGPSATVRPPAGAQVIDATGRFVVPGIINAHGHVGENRDPQLRQYALYGVTTTTSMAIDPDDIAAFKERQKQGDLRGARILTVKSRFTTLASGDPPPKTVEEARARVDELVAKGADYIKVWVDAQEGRIPKLSREICAAVFDQARMRGKVTMAHIVEYDDARAMVDLGVNILVHDVRDRELDAGFIATLKRKNVSVVPTLVREQSMFVYGQSPSWLDDPFFRKGLTSAQAAGLAAKAAQSAKLPNLAALKRAYELDAINLKKLADAGVRIALGTDSGGDPQRYFIQGFAEHRQMELMVEAGLTPMQVIQAFSKGSAETLGIDRDFGTLAKGKAADLLVLERNPLLDVRNMRSITAVYLGGRRFE